MTSTLAEKQVTGMVNQRRVGRKWAEKIKARASAEFYRVAQVVQSVLGKQTEQHQAGTQAVIAIPQRENALARDVPIIEEVNG